MEPGGCIFVGDVRSLPLLEAFHTSVQLYQVPSSLPISELQQLVHQGMNHEEELLIDPAFFPAFKEHLPKTIQVRIQPKRGRHHNEITRFRYDVILHVGSEGYPTVDHPWLDWQQEKLTLPNSASSLQRQNPDFWALEACRMPVSSQT